MSFTRVGRWPCLFLLLACHPAPLFAYSQFTHEELIDVLWATSIRPLLLQRFPGSTDEMLVRAHAYAYGGCLIQDIGYYPFGKSYFSDLTHYVRTGDFVMALLRQSRDIYEFAFAIGALSHYAGDSLGHSLAVNPSTAITFPDLALKYGPIVTFEESPVAHVRTEFGFDVAQSTWRRYAPVAYRKKIGFRVARALLYRAFHEIYGLKIGGILGPARSALTSYRWSVHKLLPLFLNAEIVVLRNRLPDEIDSPARMQILQLITTTDYARNWGNRYTKPGIGAHVIAVLIRVIPKIGKLKILAVRAPEASTADLFLASLLRTTVKLRDILEQIAAQPNLRFELEDLDLDTGLRVKPGKAKLVDQTYARLLRQIVSDGIIAPPELRADLLAFFADPSRLDLNQSPKERREMLADLDYLRRSS